MRQRHYAIVEPCLLGHQPLETEIDLRQVPNQPLEIELGVVFAFALPFECVISRVAAGDERDHAIQGRTLRIIEHHEHQRADAHHDGQPRQYRKTGRAIAELVGAVSIPRPFAPEPDVAHAHGEPHHQRRQAGYGD